MFPPDLAISKPLPHEERVGDHHLPVRSKSRALVNLMRWKSVCLLIIIGTTDSWDEVDRCRLPYRCPPPPHRRRRPRQPDAQSLPRSCHICCNICVVNCFNICRHICCNKDYLSSFGNASPEKSYILLLTQKDSEECLWTSRQYWKDRINIPPFRSFQ